MPVRRVCATARLTPLAPSAPAMGGPTASNRRVAAHFSAVAVAVAFVAAAFRRAAIATNLKPRQKTSVFKSGVAFLRALFLFFSLCPLCQILGCCLCFRSNRAQPKKGPNAFTLLRPPAPFVTLPSLAATPRPGRREGGPPKHETNPGGTPIPPGFPLLSATRCIRAITATAPLGLPV